GREPRHDVAPSRGGRKRCGKPALSPEQQEKGSTDAKGVDADERGKRNRLQRPPEGRPYEPRGEATQHEKRERKDRPRNRSKRTPSEAARRCDRHHGNRPRCCERICDNAGAAGNACPANQNDNIDGDDRRKRKRANEIEHDLLLRTPRMTLIEAWR